MIETDYPLLGRGWGWVKTS